MSSELIRPELDELALLLWLNSVPRIGPAAARHLLTHFKTPQEVFRANKYNGVAGLRPHMVAELEKAPKSLAAFEKEAGRLQEKTASLGIHVVTSLSPDYPRQLLDPTSYGPTILYVLGDPQSLGSPGGSVVGTRSPSAEAREKTRRAATTLIEHGQAVYSGMALGIDAEGHRAALTAGGKTVAVLGCGVDRLYPPENKDIYEQIKRTGAVVSEYPPGVNPSAENLRRRNRLIVGLSRFVLVAECPSDSGAMIAARAAIQQQRPVFVLALQEAGDSKARTGTELLAQVGLAEKWDGVAFDQLERSISQYSRPPSAEARLDEALGKKPAASARSSSSWVQDRKTGTAGAAGSGLQRSWFDEPLPGASVSPATSAGGSTGRSLGEAQPATTDAYAIPKALDKLPVLLRTGQRVRHARFGEGTVNQVESGIDGYIEIKFDDRTKGKKRFSVDFASNLEVLE